MKSVLVDHDKVANPIDHRPLLGEVERHHRDFLEQDVLPDIPLAPLPVRESANTRALAPPAPLPVLPREALPPPLPWPVFSPARPAPHLPSRPPFATPRA